MAACAVSWMPPRNYLRPQFQLGCLPSKHRLIGLVRYGIAYLSVPDSLPLRTQLLLHPDPILQLVRCLAGGAIDLRGLTAKDVKLKLLAQPFLFLARKRESNERAGRARTDLSTQQGNKRV